MTERSHTKSKKRKSKKFILGFSIYCLFCSILAVGIFEYVGQNYFFANKLYFVNDVDHRMIPNSSPEINSDGIRSFRESDDFNKSTNNIVFLGDSFVYGWGISYKHSIPHLLENHLNQDESGIKSKVANFGWISSSPLLSKRLLYDIGSKYNPDWVFLGLDMSDFHDDLKYRSVIERKGLMASLDYIPITLLSLRKITSHSDFLHQQLFGYPGRRFFISDRPLSKSKKFFQETKKNINDIYQFTKNKLNARFALFVFPRAYQYSKGSTPNNWEKKEYEEMGEFSLEPFKYFENLKQSQNHYPIFSLLTNFENSEVFPTTFDDDPHWNESGNEIAAEAIHRIFKNRLNN